MGRSRNRQRPPVSEDPKADLSGQESKLPVGVVLEELGPDEKIVVRDPVVYVVAPGRGVTTHRGCLGAGEAVREIDFPTGMARILDLASAGYLVAK
jgi:hypothetical protein